MTFKQRYIYSYESGNYSYSYESDKPLTPMEVAEIALGEFMKDYFAGVARGKFGYKYNIRLVGKICGSDHDHDANILNSIIFDRLGMMGLATQLRRLEKIKLG